MNLMCFSSSLGSVLMRVIGGRPTCMWNLPSNQKFFLDQTFFVFDDILRQNTFQSGSNINKSALQNKDKVLLISLCVKIT